MHDKLFGTMLKIYPYFGEKNSVFIQQINDSNDFDNIMCVKNTSYSSFTEKTFYESKNGVWKFWIQI